MNLPILLLLQDLFRASAFHESPAKAAKGYFSSRWPTSNETSQKSNLLQEKWKIALRAQTSRQWPIDQLLTRQKDDYGAS